MHLRHKTTISFWMSLSVYSKLVYYLHVHPIMPSGSDLLCVPISSLVVHVSYSHQSNYFNYKHCTVSCMTLCEFITMCAISLLPFFSCVLFCVGCRGVNESSRVEYQVARLDSLVCRVELIRVEFWPSRVLAKPSFDRVQVEPIRVEPIHRKRF